MTRFIRIAVTAALLAFVLSRVHFGELAELAGRISIPLAFLGYLLNLVMIWLNTWRWQILVDAQGTRVPMTRLVGYYFVCMFWNTFTPTSIGGDVTRVIDLARHTGRRASALASVLVERLIGLFVLLPISLFGLVATLRTARGAHGLFLYLEGLLVAILLGAGAFLGSGRVRGALLGFPLIGRLAARPGVRTRIASVESALEVYRGRVWALAAVSAISVLSRGVWILSCWVFGLAIGVTAPLVSYFLVIPLVEVARMVPLSLSGLGIREGAIVLLFSFFGVPASAALALSILIYAPFLANGLIGGAIYAARGRAPAVEEVGGA